MNNSFEKQANVHLERIHSQLFFLLVVFHNVYQLHDKRNTQNFVIQQSFVGFCV